MRKKKQSHPFTSSAAVKERDALLSRWLDPNAEGTKVVDGVAPSLRQLALDLSAHFEIRQISERAIWTYVQEARMAAESVNLVTRRRGRPVADKAAVELVGPKRPRGRPRKVGVTTENATTSDLPEGTARSPRRISAVSLNADYLAQLSAEALQLTGLSPSALHRTFAGKAGWGNFLGQRSGFFYRLKKLGGELRTADTSAVRPDSDIDHSLRLHQVVLQTLDGLWCALLFSYEPRSHFLNAACYVAHPDTTAASSTRLSGRPVERLHPDWRGILGLGLGQINFYLPPEAILTFLNETRARMAVPVDSVWLSPSFGSQSELIAQLHALAPDGRFLSIGRQHQVFMSADAGKAIRVTALCRKLESLLGQHNQSIAYAKLDVYQARIDQLIEKAFHIRALPSGRQIFRRRKRLTLLGGRAEAEVDREIAEALVEYRQSEGERPHTKSSMSLVPIHLACDVR
jgi:hypothetical protein